MPHYRMSLVRDNGQNRIFKNNVFLKIRSKNHEEMLILTLYPSYHLTKRCFNQSEQHREILLRISNNSEVDALELLETLEVMLNRNGNDDKHHVASVSINETC